MGPLCLTLCTHNEQVAVAEGEAVRGPVGVAADVKIARLTEAEAGDVGVRPKFGFAVAVPAHGVSAISVQVGEYRIGFQVKLRTKFVAECSQFWRPAVAF